MRSLNRAEKTFWLLDRVSSMNFAVAAEGTGELSGAAISRAAADLMKRHPMAAVQIVRKDLHLSFEAAHGLPEIQVIQSDWMDMLAKSLTLPFREGGPLWRITCAQQPGRFTLLITFHHCIADGRSGFRFLLDLLHTLDALQTHGASQPSMESGGGLESSGQGELPDRFRSVVFSQRSPVARPDSLPWFARKTSESVPGLSRISLSREESSAIVQNAKTNGVTVHGLVGSAQLCALASMFEARGANLALSTPADARVRLTGEDNALELCITLITSPVCAERGRMLECAREISAHIKDEMQGDFLRFFESMPDPDALLLKPEGIKLFGTMMQRGVQASVLSNVGLMDLPQFETFALDSLSFTVHPMITQPVFTTLTTCAGRMHLILNHDTVRWPAGTFETFTQNFRANLAALAALASPETKAG